MAIIANEQPSGAPAPMAAAPATSRIARPVVQIEEDGDYTLALPMRDPYEWQTTDAVPTLHAAVHGVDGVFVSTYDETRCIQHAFCVTPAAAHALAEAIHAIANRIEGKPADDDRPGAAR